MSVYVLEYDGVLLPGSYVRVKSRTGNRLKGEAVEVGAVRTGPKFGPKPPKPPRGNGKGAGNGNNV